MFTKNQFEYLCRVQWADDWHCSAFVDVLREYHESPEHEDYVNETRLEQTEFDELMAILSRADQEDLFQLQFALNSLNMLPYSMFTPKPEKVL